MANWKAIHEIASPPPKRLKPNTSVRTSVLPNSSGFIILSKSLIRLPARRNSSCICSVPVQILMTSPNPLNLSSPIPANIPSDKSKHCNNLWGFALYVDGVDPAWTRLGQSPFHRTSPGSCPRLFPQVPNLWYKYHIRFA